VKTPERAPLHPDAPDEPDTLDELTDDAIAGHFRIYQRKSGHRYSLDDVLTAFVAAEAKPDAERCLELGTGIGSVLLMLAYKLPQAEFEAVEAQARSFELLTRNVERNELLTRVRTLHGDLRDVVGTAPVTGPYDLITGTPPYVPPGKATPSTDAQRAFARQEYRGGVEAYIEAAARVLGAQGRLVVCADARHEARVASAARPQGLTLLARLDAIPRAGTKGPLFSVFTLGFTNEHATPPTSCISSFTARAEDGARTEQYVALRAFFDLPRRY
jgi:tRNA1(Val) A37 N6-methylase TrmN6